MWGRGGRRELGENDRNSSVSLCLGLFVVGSDDCGGDDGGGGGGYLLRQGDYLDFLEAKFV
jgi:hypothetical protein